jgi:uncharacterized RDD family membrane protein YckC
MTPAPPAGFWRRYAAYSLDCAVLGPLAALLTWPRITAGAQAARVAIARLYALAGQRLGDLLLAGQPPDALLHDPGLLAAADAVQAGLLQALRPWLFAYALLALLWHVGGERSRWRGSPGKRALQLEVVAADGDGDLGLARGLARHGAALLSWLSFNLGHVLAALPPQKRALHDYVAGARVVCRAQASRLPAWAALWLALQGLAGAGLLAWGAQRYLAALQSALG